MKRHIPNILTVLRFPLTILFLYGFLARHETGWHITATICFIISAITDGLDGAIARRTGNVSRIGAFLDPLADKFLVLSGFFALFYRNDMGWNVWKPIILISVIVIAAREVGITWLRSLKEARGKPIVTSYMAKAKTTAQLITLITAQVALGFQELFHFSIPLIIHLIGLGVVVSAVLAALSAYDYMRQ